MQEVHSWAVFFIILFFRRLSRLPGQSNFIVSLFHVFQSWSQEFMVLIASAGSGVRN
ncbi:MAG: hypothetical protein MUE60_10545 [Candidatus Eisenbacteria bacterium]|nr:hypothetical protein [Candidatus Eisenbacteria bacterium]